MENIRKINLIKTEEILATFKEGSETDRLIQISNFILENCEYVNTLNTDISTFWDKEYGSCTTFALTFKHFANRLGIKCDLIISPGSDGVDHTYNRVTLQDGSVKYYDLIRPNRYINTDQIDQGLYGNNIAKARPLMDRAKVIIVNSQFWGKEINHMR